MIMVLCQYLFSDVIIELDDGSVVVGKVVGYEPDFDTDSGEDEIEIEMPEIEEAYLGLRESDIQSIVKVE